MIDANIAKFMHQNSLSIAKGNHPTRIRLSAEHSSTCQRVLPFIRALVTRLSTFQQSGTVYVNTVLHISSNVLDFFTLIRLHMDTGNTAIIDNATPALNIFVYNKFFFKRRVS